MHQSLMNRRQWLGATMTTAAAAHVPVFAADAEGKSTELEIIDCHTHFYDPTRPEGVPWPNKNSFLYRTVLVDHLRQLKQYRRVTGTVIVEASAWLEDNAWLLDLAKDDPFVVGIVGNLKTGTPGFAAHIKHFAANPLFRGIRVQVTALREMLSRNDFSDLNVLADHDLALDINGGPETPAVVAKVAEKVPALRFVQNHIGNVHITNAAPPQDWQDSIRAAGRQPGVYCKISALVEGAARGGKTPPTNLEFYKPYIDVVWDAFGDDRVIYGSNWPVSEGAADYFTLQRIVMEYAATRGDDATAKFCSKNAKRAYKWLDRPGRR